MPSGPRRNPKSPGEVEQTQLGEAGPSEEIRGVHGRVPPLRPNDRFDVLVPATFVAGGQRRMLKDRLRLSSEIR